jgi:hypothetical protein
MRLQKPFGWSGKVARIDLGVIVHRQIAINVLDLRLKKRTGKVARDELRNLIRWYSGRHRANDWHENSGLFSGTNKSALLSLYHRFED